MKCRAHYNTGRREDAPKKSVCRVFRGGIFFTFYSDDNRSPLRIRLSDNDFDLASDILYSVIFINVLS